MNDNSLTVVAEMTALPGKEGALRQELLKLVEASRREEGCLQYDLFVGADDPRLFIFLENWTSRAALDRHLQSPHIRAFANVSRELRETPRILTYTRIA